MGQVINLNVHQKTTAQQAKVQERMEKRNLVPENCLVKNILIKKFFSFYTDFFMQRPLHDVLRCCFFSCLSLWNEISSFITTSRAPYDKYAGKISAKYTWKKRMNDIYKFLVFFCTFCVYSFNMLLVLKAAFSAIHTIAVPVIVSGVAMNCNDK